MCLHGQKVSFLVANTAICKCNFSFIDAAASDQAFKPSLLYRGPHLVGKKLCCGPPTDLKRYVIVQSKKYLDLCSRLPAETALISEIPIRAYF